MRWKPRDWHKYNAKKFKIGALTFDSRKEADHYQVLMLLKRTGKIQDFELKPKFELQPKFKFGKETIRAITIVPDFLVSHLDGTKEVIDTKGIGKPYLDKNGKLKTFSTCTTDWKIKWKILKYKHPEYKYTIV